MRIAIAILLTGLLMPAAADYRNSDSEEKFTDSVSSYPLCDEILSHVDLLPGDIVMRRGDGVISGLFARIASKDQKFSHAGIVVSASPEVIVAHVIGTGASGRAEFRTESISHFLAPHCANEFSIHRLQLSGICRDRIDPYFRTLKFSNIIFDEDFDLSTDDEQYCSELIYKCLVSVTGNAGVMSLSEAGGRMYVSFDDLTRDTQTLFSYIYNQL